MSSGPCIETRKIIKQFISRIPISKPTVKEQNGAVYRVTFNGTSTSFLKSFENITSISSLKNYESCYHLKYILNQYFDVLKDLNYNLSTEIQIYDHEKKVISIINRGLLANKELAAEKSEFREEHSEVSSTMEEEDFILSMDIGKIMDYLINENLYYSRIGHRVPSFSSATCDKGNFLFFGRLLKSPYIPYVALGVAAISTVALMFWRSRRRRS
jgi:hypothetical protein